MEMGSERATRGVWIVRGLIAILAVGLLALVVHRSTSYPANADWLKLTAGHGRTAQGAAMEMRFDRPGHPLAFKTHIRTRCANGSHWSAAWSAFDGTAGAFHRDGRGLQLVKISDRTFRDGTFGQIVFSMRATLGPGGRQARGWVRLTVAFSRAHGWTMPCDSGRVPFAIDAPLASLASPSATSARPS
jgi:hypothetical protein